MSEASGRTADPVQDDRHSTGRARITNVHPTDNPSAPRAEDFKSVRLIPGAERWRTAATIAPPVLDDLAREVYCILGIPIDAIEMPATLCRVEAAAAAAEPFVLSTPNLNFLVNSQTDDEFRELLLMSDLCPPDGAPIIWIARLLGIPIRERTAGSDIFDALKI